MRATLYRDGEYGALAVIPAEGAGARLLVIDHAFNAGDYDAALIAFERMGGRPEELAEGTVWMFSDRAEVVRANLDLAMRARGYGEDPLGERAILFLEPDAARTPDLPAPDAPRFRVPEAVERALLAHANQALVAFAPPDVLAAPPSVRFFPRLGMVDEYREPLPFVRARALVRGPTDPGLTEAARRRLRDALAPVRGCLVRATVAPVAAGRLAVEFAFAPPPGAIRAIRERAVPAFTPITPVGVRPVRLILNALMSEAAALDLAGRAVAGTVAASLARPSPRVVTARIVAGREGDSIADDAFQERLVWLMRALEAWDPSLEDIGPLAPLLAERGAALTGAPMGA